jgi:hypothetical protein
MLFLSSSHALSLVFLIPPPLLLLLLLPGKSLVGAWKDSFNRTVFICPSWKTDTKYVYFSWSEVNGPTNTSIIGWGNWTIEDDHYFRISGEYFRVINYTRKDGEEWNDYVDRKEFILKEQRDDDNDDKESVWSGNMDDKDWKLVTRLCKFSSNLLHLPCPLLT